jgi:hypothetical protein
MDLDIDIELDEHGGYTAELKYKDDEFQISLGSTVASMTQDHKRLAVVRWHTMGISIQGTKSLFPEVFEIMKIHPKWDNGGAGPSIPKYKLQKGALKALVLKKLTEYLSANPERLEVMINDSAFAAHKEGRMEAKGEFRDWMKED